MGNDRDVLDVDALLSNPADEPAAPAPLPRVLDPDQRAVVAWNKGEAVVAAGAGSGKTTTLIEWIGARLDEGVRPERIGAFAFNTSAGTKLKADARARFGVAVGDRLSAGTIHGVCYRLFIRSHNGDPRANPGAILDTPPRRRRGDGTEDEPERETLRSWQIVDPILKAHPDRMQAFDVQAKDVIKLSAAFREAMIDVDRPGPKLRAAVEAAVSPDHVRIVEDAIVAFQRVKVERGVLDFTDMLYLFWRGLATGEKWTRDARSMFDHGAFDESQDANPVQVEIFEWLTADATSRVWIGDLRQAIYEFRGARPSLLMDRIAAGAALLPMAYNYRSDGEIIAAANRFATGLEWHVGGDAKIPPGRPSTPGAFSVDPGVEPVDEIRAAVAAGSEPREFAILSRTNAGLATYEAALGLAGVPFYSTTGAGGVWETFAAKTLLAYVRLAVDKATLGDVAWVANKPNRFVSKDRVLVPALGVSDKAAPVRNVGAALEDFGRRSKPARQFANDVLDLQGADWPDQLSMIGGWLERDVRQRTPPALDADEDQIAMIAELAAVATKAGSYADLLRLIADAGAIRVRDPEKQPNHVRLSTVHKAKGQQWPVVYVEAAGMPHEKAREVWGEEARIFYVAITRAERRCVVLPGNRPEYTEKVAGRSPAGSTR